MTTHDTRTGSETAIPADVMEAAKSALLVEYSAYWDDFEEISEVIARAIMAERERSALVAAEFSTHWGVAYKTMTDQIADAIRLSTPTQEINP